MVWAHDSSCRLGQAMPNVVDDGVNINRKVDGQSSLRLAKGLLKSVQETRHRQRIDGPSPT